MAKVTELRRRSSLQDWRERIRYTTVGKPPKEYQVIKPTLPNLITTFQHHPDWLGVLAYDELSASPIVLSAPFDSDAPFVAGPWGNAFPSLVSIWLERTADIGCSNTRLIEEAMCAAAQCNSFHPIRDYLGSLEWDGIERLDAWLMSYCQAVDSDYTRAVGARWMISAIARVMQPGCKADCMLILRGEQGAKKSSAFAVLGGEWFCDTAFDMGSKDGFETIRTTWIYEAAELSRIRGSDLERVKAFMSARKDTYRPPYGRRALEFKRQVVLCGTVNPNGVGYLNDPTGNRRFWDVLVGKIDLTALARDRDQLWAEAMLRYKAGAAWWLDTEELVTSAATHQEHVTVNDEWEDVLHAYVTKRDNAHLAQHGVQTQELLSIALGIDKGKITRGDSTRVGIAMAKLGWMRRQVQVNGRRTWLLYPKHAPGTTEELFPIGPE